jgi:hypothetical protein
VVDKDQGVIVTFDELFTCWAFAVGMMNPFDSGL